MEDNIKRFINRPTIITNNIDIKQEININNKKYVLFIINNDLGDAELTKGFNNKYKINSTGYGSIPFRHHIYKQNNTSYYIIEGKNYNMKIHYVKILLGNKEYKISIPSQEYFLGYCEISNEIQDTYPDINNLKLYDKNNIDITKEMFEKYFD